MTPAERQKVYDYFGFELKFNKNGTQVDDDQSHSFSIIGYPVNLNNGKKLAKIEDPSTKAVVEQLRPEVIKFSENNRVSCQNQEIEIFVNEVLDLCPELRTQIGRSQEETHSYDVFKQSLKTMQKVTQNSEFDSLCDSDKKVLLLASLLHDGNKAEGYSDSVHSDESAFDAFYITKKFGLSQEEANKLYALIKKHEWLGYTTDSKVQIEERESRIKSVAYDLHYDNLFEMSKILTEADLKATETNNGFFNKIQNVYSTISSKVGTYVNELKTTQPLLPVTKIPSSTRIKEAITIVNPDGSTNLKGIYQDENGMVIIKFNEVENETWEKIGFPKGSISSGINTTGYSSSRYGNVSENAVDTDNIKFFAHGLDHSEQMRNFDVFALPDSDALLSVSYMERPESKYKLFRKQGLLLDVDTKYVHGGGETDSGSGCKKSLDLFKKDYAYSEGRRHSDRVYIANLIKGALNLTDDEYVEFIKNNANKPISEIEPKEYQEPLIKAFATINSNERRGERSYNEMYITNPKPMGVFAYSYSGLVGNIMDFISNRVDFLKNYAVEEDMPFIVFGD